MELVDGNRITLLENGVEYFPALGQALDAARREIHLETYIFESDGTGRAIAAALARAAKRGVSTHVMVDGFGSQNLSRDLIDGMQAAGVHFLVYRPQVSPWTFKRSRLRRLHRKLAVIDAQTAFVGGINILDDADAVRGIPPRFDYAVRVEGPLVAGIYPLVKRLWKLVSATQLRARRPETSSLVPDLVRRGNQRAAFLVRDNIGHRREIEEAYLEAIERSRSEVLIANAYFFPGLSFRRALMDAAARGVQVKLLLQGRAEYVLLYYASRALYGAFLEAGIEIHEYFRSFLHAKVAVIDRHWSTVGSSNIDPFSLVLAREANVVVEDSAFAERLRGSLVRAMDQDATQLKHERWSHQPLPVRIATWACYGVTRFLTGVFAYGRAGEYA
ncbi:MAG TPA: cardiolipin synthase ClsB [Burkholderiales bacterium]|nr:cardiolipin synthase ClsB [Burkholderiales bacterium]